MTLDDLANISELIGALGVVISLIYLAAQIRQNTRASQAETYQELISAFIATLNSLGSSPQSARIFDTGLRNLDDLKGEERTQFILSITSFFVAFENAFYQYRKSTLEPELWERWHRQLDWYAKRAGVVAWWAFAQRNFSDSFREFVNELIRRNSGAV